MRGSASQKMKQRVSFPRRLQSWGWSTLGRREWVRSEGPEQSQRHSEGDVHQVLDDFKTVVQLQDLIMNEKNFFFHRGHLRCSYQLQKVLKWQILWTISKPIHAPVSPPWSLWASLLIRLRIPVLPQLFHTFQFARNSLLVPSAKSILFRPYVSEIPTSPGKYIGIIMEFLPTSSS